MLKLNDHCEIWDAWHPSCRNTDIHKEQVYTEHGFQFKFSYWQTLVLHTRLLCFIFKVYTGESDTICQNTHLLHKQGNNNTNLIFAAQESPMTIFPVVTWRVLDGVSNRKDLTLFSHSTGAEPQQKDVLKDVVSRGKCELESCL